MTAGVHPPQAPPPRPAPRPPRPRPKSSWFGRIFLGLTMFFGCLIIMSTCASIGNLGGPQLEVIGTGSDQVGVVELVGPIMDTQKPVRHLHMFAARESIVAIVVRVDSPGGAVAPSQEMFDAMRFASAKKPVVVSMGNTAASGGLWVAMGGDYIFALPGSVTGSLGVISQTPDLHKLAKLAKFDMRTFKSGTVKDVGNPLRPMAVEDEKLFMSLLSDIFTQFVDVVASRRNLPHARVLEFADGRVMTGKAALDVGLVDALGGLHAAATHAIYMYRKRDAAEGIEPVTDDIRPILVYPKKPIEGVWQLLAEGAGEAFFAGATRAVREGVYEALRAQVSVELR